MFFLELNCNNNTIKVTENNCKIIPDIIKIKLEAQPGMALSVNKNLNQKGKTRTMREFKE